MSVVFRWCLGGVSVCRWYVGGVSVVSRCYLGDVLVVSRWSLGSVSVVSVVSWWCLGVSPWCLGGVSTMSRWWSRWGLGGVSWCLSSVSMVSRWCFGGVWVVSQWCLMVVSRWCLGGVLVVSRWGLGRVGVSAVRRWCLGGVAGLGGVLVVSQQLPCWFKVFKVSWSYLGGVVLVVSGRLCWWSVGCAMHQVVFNSCMLLSWRRRRRRRRPRRRRRWWWWLWRWRWRWWWWWWWWWWWGWRWRWRWRWRCRHRYRYPYRYRWRWWWWGPSQWRQRRRWRCDDDLAFAGLSWSGGMDGCLRMLWSNLRTNYDYDASTQATADIPSVHAATRAVGCSPHQRSWHTCCMLHLHRDPRVNLSKEKGIRIENQQEKKTGHNPDRRKGKKEGGREGRRTAGRKKRSRPSSWMLRALSHVHMVLSNSWRAQAICKCWSQNVAKTVQFTDVSRNTLQTPCHVVQSADDKFQDVANTAHLQVWASESRKNGIQLTDVNFEMLRMPCGLPVIVAKTTQCTETCTSTLHILCKWWPLVFSKNCEHPTVCRLFASERREHHSTVCRYDPISCNYHAICRRC